MSNRISRLRGSFNRRAAKACDIFLEDGMDEAEMVAVFNEVVETRRHCEPIVRLGEIVSTDIVAGVAECQFIPRHLSGEKNGMEWEAVLRGIDGNNAIYMIS